MWSYCCITGLSLDYYDGGKEAVSLSVCLSMHLFICLRLLISADFWLSYEVRCQSRSLVAFEYEDSLGDNKLHFLRSLPFL